MFSLGFEQKEVERLLTSMENITFSTTSNRSVTATMNDMKRHIDGYLYQERSLVGLDEYINRLIFKRTDYDKPMELFKSELQQI